MAGAPSIRSRCRREKSRRTRSGGRQGPLVRPGQHRNRSAFTPNARATSAIEFVEDHRDRFTTELRRPLRAFLRCEVSPNAGMLTQLLGGVMDTNVFALPCCHPGRTQKPGSSVGEPKIW